MTFHCREHDWRVESSATRRGHSLRTSEDRSELFSVPPWPTRSSENRVQAPGGDVDEAILFGDPRGQPTAPDAPRVEASEAGSSDQPAASPMAEHDRPLVASPPMLEPRGEARRFLIGQRAIFGTTPDAGSEARARMTFVGVETPCSSRSGILPTRMQAGVDEQHSRQLLAEGAIPQPPEQIVPVGCVGAARRACLRCAPPFAQPRLGAGGRRGCRERRPRSMSGAGAARPVNRGRG